MPDKKCWLHVSSTRKHNRSDNLQIAPAHVTTYTTPQTNVVEQPTCLLENTCSSEVEFHFLFFCDIDGEKRREKRIAIGRMGQRGESNIAGEIWRRVSCFYSRFFLFIILRWFRNFFFAKYINQHFLSEFYIIFLRTWWVMILFDFPHFTTFSTSEFKTFITYVL